MYYCASKQIIIMYNRDVSRLIIVMATKIISKILKLYILCNIIFVHSGYHCFNILAVVGEFLRDIIL